MYYHIKLLENKNSGETHINMTEDELFERYINPYLNGESIVINGKSIVSPDNWRVIITSTENNLDELIKKIKNDEIKRETPYRLFGINPVWAAIDTGKDETNLYINKPFGYKKKEIWEKKHATIDNKKVFVVHGHDDEAQVKTARFIEKLGLIPIILHEQASSGKTIIEKIEEYSDVGFGIVLYTPCDIGGKQIVHPVLNSRARQNVVFEHGFLIGKIGRKNVCALVKGDIETPNDISGVVYISMDKDQAWHIKIAKELKNSGFDVDLNKTI